MLTTLTGRGVATKWKYLHRQGAHMCTAHVVALMLVAAGTSAEFGLATSAAVSLGATAISMKMLAPSFRIPESCRFTRETSSTIQCCRSARRCFHMYRPKYPPPPPSPMTSREPKELEWTTSHRYLIQSPSDCLRHFRPSPVVPGWSVGRSDWPVLAGYRSWQMVVL